MRRKASTSAALTAMPHSTKACGHNSGQPAPRRITPRAASISQVVGMTRAIVWRLTGEKQRGTRIAAKLGQAFGLLLAGLGVWLLLSYRSFTGLWLIAIAFLLYQSARAAITGIQYQSRRACRRLDGTLA